MKKLFILLLMQLIASGIYADVDRTRIYYFDTSDHNEENWIYYRDQLIFDDTYLLTEGCPSISSVLDTLDFDKTYLFKVSYTIAGYEYVDSCFTSYTCNLNLTDPEEIYLRDLYGELDYGTFMMDNQYCGFCNISRNAPCYFEVDEFEDEYCHDEDEIIGMMALRGTYFFLDCTSVTHVRIEIFEYP